MSEQDIEFEAIQTVYKALSELKEDEARTRVMTYISSRLGIGRVGTDSTPLSTVDASLGSDAGEADDAQVGYDSFAELFAAANPKSNGEKALVAGYWIQTRQGEQDFAAAAAQKELTHLGHKIANITDAIDSMKSQKPMLMLQVKKSGSSRQARKRYKISDEGVKRVEEMTRG